MHCTALLFLWQRSQGSQIAATADGQVHAATSLWRRSSPPAKSGLLHAGGVLEDALLPRHSLGSLRRVLAPKLAGLLHLAHASAAGPPASTALFSSIASMLGSPGQGNYAAANAALDGWALRAQRQGHACSSLRWGAWSSVGMAAASPQLLARLQRQVTLCPAAC